MVHVVGDFLAPEAGDLDSGDLNRRATDYARLNRRERELDDQDLAALAEDYSRRAQRPAMRYSGDLNDVPQRLLMPSVHDANLWQVRVKVLIFVRLLFSPTNVVVAW